MAVDAGLLGSDRSDDLEPGVVVVDAGTARAAAVLQALEPLAGESAPPGGDRIGPDADLGCDLPVGDAVGGQQDDARPAQGLLAGGMSTRAAFQFGPLSVGDNQRWQSGHRWPLRYRVIGAQSQSHPCHFRGGVLVSAPYVELSS
jgi:hypothetical protein